MVRALKWLGGTLVVLVLTVGVLQLAASERVEVVELHTLDDAGETHTTRLWIVDHEGVQYLRAGMPDSGWLQRATANNEVRMTRNGETRVYRVERRDHLRDTINQRLNDKYTWGDDIIGLLTGNRTAAIPVALIEN